MKTRKLTQSALFAALLILCAWISVPTGGISFTLQTFALFLSLLLLGGKWGSVTVLVYLTLGAVGLPVFSGFQGGLGTLFGPSGGFLFGFMLTCLTYALITFFWKHPAAPISGLLLGLLLCYGAGWLWYCRFAPVPFFLWVLPYLLPDLFKLLLALFLARRLKKHLSVF